MKNKITKDNFFIDSVADFKMVDSAPDREPDYISYKRGFVSYDEEDGDEDFRVIDGKEYILLSKYDPRDPQADEDGCVTDLFLIVGKKFNFNDELIGLYYLDKDIVSSTYWYTEEGVYRKSNHWGWCRDCYWTIDRKEYNSHKEIVGYCKWEDFRDDDFHPLTDEEKPCEKIVLRGVLRA